MILVSQLVRYFFAVVIFVDVLYLPSDESLRLDAFTIIYLLSFEDIMMICGLLIAEGVIIIRRAVEIEDEFRQIVGHTYSTATTIAVKYMTARREIVL